MVKATFIEKVGYVSNIALTLQFIRKLSKRDVTELELESLIELDKTIYMNMSIVKKDSSNASIKLVPISLRTEFDEEIYLFFRRKNVGTLKEEKQWFGTKVGTLKSLSFVINNESFADNFVLDEIYNLLLDREYWKEDGSESPYNRLRLYLNFELKFLTSYLRFNNGTTYNRDRSKIIFNSRLFSKYGDYIILIADCIRPHLFRNVRVLNSNISLESLNFPPLVDVAPPNLFSDSNFIFTDEYNDFHLIDYGRLHHILDDRIDRFRDLKRDMVALDLMMTVRNSIQMSVLQSKTNPNYIHPMYSVEYNTIQFLLPIFTEFSYGSKPQCAMMIKKNSSGLWALQTVLDIETAYMSARIIKKPENSWLNLGDG